MAQSTVIGPSSFVRGRVSGDGDLEIAGRVEGDVATSGTVVVEASGLVAANIAAARVVVRGAVKGDLSAEESLVIEAGAKVVGDLSAPRITIAAGGLVRGHVQTGGALAAAPRPRAASAAASRAAEPKARPAPPAARSAAAPPPPKAKATEAKANGPKPPPRGATLAGARVPPPPVVPVLKKGTKAVQKKRA